MSDEEQRKREEDLGLDLIKPIVAMAIAAPFGMALGCLVGWLIIFFR